MAISVGRRWAAVVLVGAVAAPAAASEPSQAPLTVGAVSARPGERASGWLEVPDGVDPGTRIPISIVHGVRPGPVLALIAGTHGYEYTAILALPRVLARLDPARMSGSVILVHMVSPPAFYGRNVYRGPDGKNQNRVYPGKPDGTLSERIAHALTREVIGQATHLADLHGGDGNESLRPYVYWQVSGNAAVDAGSKELALAFGLDHIVVDRERPKDPGASLYTSNTAVLRGKPAITAEFGGMGLTDEASVGAQEAGALSLIAQLEIMDLPRLRVERPLWIDRSQVVTSPATGVWQPVVEKMQLVASGTLLGRLSDPFGRLLHEVRAPFAGEVLYVVATPPVSQGEPLAFIGEVSETPPAR